jgi:hypothetical protein
MRMFNPVNDVVALIDGKLKKMVHEGKITEVNRKYIKGESVNLGRFYLLPKIHKRLSKGQVGQWFRTVGRPQSVFLSLWITILILYNVKCLPSVLVDTSDFLRRLENVGYIPETAIFGTIDVVGLYPHIPHDEGLDSMRKILEEFRDKTTFSEWFVDGVDLLEMAKMILENNYFEFNEQRQGTAI